jgi:hypothetical protein
VADSMGRLGSQPPGVGSTLRHIAVLVTRNRDARKLDPRRGRAKDEVVGIIGGWPASRTAPTRPRRRKISIVRAATWLHFTLGSSPPARVSATVTSMPRCVNRANSRPYAGSARRAGGGRLDEPGKRDLVSLIRLLVPAPPDLLAMQPSSPLVNSVKNEGPELLDYTIE